MGTNTYSFHLRISILCHFYRWSLALHLVLSIENQSWFLSHLHQISNLGWKSVLTKIKIFQSDGGIHHQISCLYTPSQNGRAERKHKHLTETSLTMLFHANSSIWFWVEAFSIAIYIINRLPTPVLNELFPFEILYGKTPAYAIFHTFGCLCFPYLRDYAKIKFEPHSVPCIFLGYTPSYKGFRYLDLTSHWVFVTKHARFRLLICSLLQLF